MTINDVLASMFACAAGAGLGAFFFGGLWWTIEKGIASKQPALWFSGSLILRMSATIGGFYLVSSHCHQLLFCLTGFVIVGLISTLLARRSTAKQSTPLQEISHAP